MIYWCGSFLSDVGLRLDGDSRIDGEDDFGDSSPGFIVDNFQTRSKGIPLEF